jgi:hypothetical protein
MLLLPWSVAKGSHDRGQAGDAIRHRKVLASRALCAEKAEGRADESGSNPADESTPRIREDA